MKTIPLSETTKFIVDNRGRTAPTEEVGIPLIATNCISNNDLYPSYERLRFVSEETYKTWFRSHPVPGDIILTNKGSQNGAICLVPDPVEFVIAQDMVALRANEEIIDPLFLFAALRSTGVQRQIKDLDVSGVIPHLKKGDFDKLHLPFPERDVQEQIGKIYFDFCHKIELNRRMNATLESMARALFQSWFVDFDPVRRNAEGATPRPEDSLFPDSFEDSNAEEVPLGWIEGRVDDLASLSRATLTPANFHDETFSHYSLPAFDDGKVPRLDLGSDIKSNKTLIPNDSVLISKLNPRIPRVWLPSTSGDNRAISSTEFLVVIPKRGVSREFLYCLLGAEKFMNTLTTMVTGTSNSHQRIRPDSLMTMATVIPPASVIQRFTKAVAPMLQRIQLNIDESRTLAATRDALLPHLLSGEISETRTKEELKEVSR